MLTSLIQQVALSNDLPSNIPADLLACREVICHAMSEKDELLSNIDEMELIKQLVGTQAGQLTPSGVKKEKRGRSGWEGEKASQINSF